MSTITVCNIAKEYDGCPILRNISLAINSGEMVAILGQSGVGKSTLLKLIAGLEAPDSGEILFDGEPVQKMPAEKRGAVLVFQDYLLFPHLTVWQNVAFGLKMAKQPARQMEETVAAMLRLVQMDGYETKYPDALSGGQKQRVALARALAIRPRVLLLDEPFSSLDPELRETTRDFVRALQRQVRITTMLVTHDWEEALMLSDKVGIIIDGELAQFGTPQDIYLRPASLKVTQLLGSGKNYIAGRVENELFHSVVGSFAAAGCPNGEYTAVVRAEQVTVAVDPAGEWTITDLKFAGNYTMITLRGFGDTLTCMEKAGLACSIGDNVRPTVDFSQALLFESAKPGACPAQLP